MTRGDVLQEFHPDAFHSIVVACKKECSYQCSLFSLLPFTFAYLTFLSQFLSFFPEARRSSCTSRLSSTLSQHLLLLFLPQNTPLLPCLHIDVTCASLSSFSEVSLVHLLLFDHHHQQ
jgi:hypothetical protein